jgi:hypothetical protein
MSVPGRPVSQTPPKQRDPREISTLVQSAGLIEQAREKLNLMHDVDRGLLERLKTISDFLVAEAAGQKITIANDFMQQYGRE